MDLDTALTDKPAFSVATNLLRADHEEISRLFDDYQEAIDEDSPARQNLAQAICMQVELHGRVEAEIFYPAVRDHAPEIVAEFLDDYREIAPVIAELRAPLLRMQDCDAHMLDLMDLVESHIAAEEMELFPLLEDRMDLALHSLGVEILHYKERLMGSTADLAARS